MKRFHVHMNVAEIEANIRFYSRLFGAEPVVRRDDYAKWMLDDPRLNFAISVRGREPGVDHLGLQAHDDGELQEIGARLKAADAVALAENATTCCYARSDKYWAIDPQGTRWESFHTHGEATSYYAPQLGVAVSASACCGPQASAEEPASCATACEVPPERQIPAPGASACCAR